VKAWLRRIAEGCHNLLSGRKGPLRGPFLNKGPLRWSRLTASVPLPPIPFRKAKDEKTAFAPCSSHTSLLCGFPEI